MKELYKDNQKPDIESKKADIEIKKADIDSHRIYDSDIKKFSQKTINHIQNIFSSIEIDSIFGRSDVQRITKLGASRASELLKDLVDAQIIEAVNGYGKGKYRFIKKHI